MPSRSRKRRSGAPAPPAAPGTSSRSELREAEARAGLQPLAPGERPTAVTVAAVVAALIGAANLALFAGGYEIRGQEPSGGGVVALSAIMLVAAAAMWRGKYWAVLGFQALMAVTCVFAGLSLMVASNVEAALRSVAVLAGAGALFWALIKAMARLQMPRRPGREE